MGLFSSLFVVLRPGCSSPLRALFAGQLTIAQDQHPGQLKRDPGEELHGIRNVFHRVTGRCGEKVEIA
jgi:hypothetical protein